MHNLTINDYYDDFVDNDEDLLISNEIDEYIEHYEKYIKLMHDISPTHPKKVYFYGPPHVICLKMWDLYLQILILELVFGLSLITFL